MLSDKSAAADKYSMFNEEWKNGKRFNQDKRSKEKDYGGGIKGIQK